MATDSNADHRRTRGLADYYARAGLEYIPVDRDPFPVFEYNPNDETMMAKSKKSAEQAPASRSASASSTSTAESTPTLPPIPEVNEPASKTQPTPAKAEQAATTPVVVGANNTGSNPAPVNVIASTTTTLITKPGDTLEVIRTEVANCTKCDILCSSRKNTVFSDGTPAAKIVFVGEAPGADEDEQGIPFVGRAGQLLTKIIEACKLRREDIYIMNVLKCRPPNNRPPEPEEIENCWPYFERQLAQLNPTIMVALGRFATAALLRTPPDKIMITKIRGRIEHYAGVPFMITLHPSYLLRNPSAKADVWEDMKKVMKMVGQPID